MKATLEFSAPTRVHFGCGARSRLAVVLESGPWGFVGSPAALSRSLVSEVLAACRARGVRIIQLGGVSPNPRIGEVEAALERAEQQELRGIVAVGGGSALDAAKLLAVAYRHGSTAVGALRDLGATVHLPRRRTARLVVVPTTAGTGAEVSQGAIITDDKSGKKLAARGAALVPDEAVIDPELAVTLPRRQTAEIGFDIIAHATETYLSLVATPFTDALALAALRTAPEALVRAVTNGQDIEARTELALYSWLMGYNLVYSSNCLPHRMQYPVGSLTDTSHQIGLAALYPAWISTVAVAAPDRMQRLAEAITSSLRVADSPSPTALFSTLLDRLGLRVTLRDLGVKDTDIPALAAAVEGRIDLDPIQPSRKDIVDLYMQSLGN